MTYEEWKQTYLPVTTHTHTWHGSEIFEIYGDDLQFVDSCDKLHVWTLVETDMGGERIIEGMRFVNRIGYFVTVRPWSEPVEVNPYE